MTSYPFSVVHLSSSRESRGGERQVRLLHEGLLARGVRSLLLCRPGSGLAGIQAESVCPVAPLGLWDIPGLLRLVRVLRSARPAILHCHDAHALAYGAAVRGLSGASLVATRRVLFRPGRGPLSRWKYARCSMLIAISEAVRQQCAELVGESRTALVHSAVRWGTDDAERAEARRKLGLAEADLVVGTVGHFTAEKNLPVLRAAATVLQKTHPGARIVCVGPAAPSQAGDPLRFTGPVPEAARYYRAFDHYVSASRLEGLGTALVDAVVRDIPSVATDAGGTRDIYPDGWQLVPPGDPAALADALRWSIDHPEESRNRAREAGQRARKLFAVDTLVEGTMEVYRRTAQGAQQERRPPGLL